jgi:NAD-dependent dihydropyrimidine dehydrogenase PreA subunit
VIEVVSAARCVGCDKCVEVCPTDVFRRGDDGIPVIARQGDCQTCFLCEAYCPVDALFVAPQRVPLPPGSLLADEQHLVATGMIGSYREKIGWGKGRVPGARLAVGPALQPRPPVPVPGKPGVFVTPAPR